MPPFICVQYTGIVLRAYSGNLKKLKGWQKSPAILKMAGIMQVGLDFDIPIANAVLTTENDEQTQARLHQKGTDAAQVAVEMANLRKEFEYDMGDGE